MTQKTHVGFNKKGELTSGKCEANKRACPYGNHFADPNEAHTYLEEVSEALQSLPPELVEGYKTHAEVMGDSKIPFDEAVEMGFPEDIAHLIAGEPTEPKYARENVGKDIEPAEPVADVSEVKEEPIEEPKSSPMGAEPEVKEATPPQEEPKVASVDASNPKAKLLEEIASAGINHDRYPMVPIELDTDEGYRLFRKVLDSYRLSDGEEFEAMSPYLRDAIYKGHDPNGDRDRMKKELHRYAGAVNALRTGNLERLNERDKVRREMFDNVLLSYIETDYEAGKAYDKQGIHLPGSPTFRAMANYGEFGNEINDLITQDTLFRKMKGEDKALRRQAEEVIDGHLIHNDGVAGDADWHRVIGPYGIPRSAPTEMGYEPDIEMNKFRHRMFINKYTDMLAKDAGAKKSANATAKGLYVDEIKANIEAYGTIPRSVDDSILAKPFAYRDDDFLANDYYEESGRRVAEKLKPGAYVMLHGHDAEVYQIDDEGALITPDGKTWGYVDTKSGKVYNAHGRNVTRDGGGVTVYADDNELISYAALDDRPGLADDEIVSSDPGYRSRYEDDPKYAKKYARALEYLKREEKALAHASTIRQEYSTAISGKDTGELYKVATSRFGMPAFDKELADDNSSEGQFKKEIMVQDFLEKQFNDGKAKYNPKTGSIVKANRKPLSDYKPKKSLVDLLGTTTPVATKMSIINAARRSRNRVTTQGDEFAGAFEPKLTENNPSAHRRRVWDNKRVAPKYARTGDILFNSVNKEKDQHPTFVVVDREKGHMVPLHTVTSQHRNTKSSSDAKGLLVPHSHQSMTSDYAVTDIINRYKMGDNSLEVLPMPYESDNDYDLILW